MGLEDRSPSIDTEAPVPNSSTSLVVGGVHLRETPPIEDLPLEPLQYVAVGLSDPTQFDPAEFDRATKALKGDDGDNAELKYVVVEQVLDRTDLKRTADLLLVFPVSTAHGAIIERLAAAGCLFLLNQAAGFIKRRKGPEGATYQVYGNSDSLRGVPPFNASNEYRDGELVPFLKKAGVKVKDYAGNRPQKH